MKSEKWKSEMHFKPNWELWPQLPRHHRQQIWQLPYTPRGQWIQGFQGLEFLCFVLGFLRLKGISNNKNQEEPFGKRDVRYFPVWRETLKSIMTKFSSWSIIKLSGLMSMWTIWLLWMKHNPFKVKGYEYEKRKRRKRKRKRREKWEEEKTHLQQVWDPILKLLWSDDSRQWIQFWHDQVNFLKRIPKNIQKLNDMSRARIVGTLSIQLNHDWQFSVSRSSVPASCKVFHCDICSHQTITSLRNVVRTCVTQDSFFFVSPSEWVFN